MSTNISYPSRSRTDDVQASTATPTAETRLKAVQEIIHASNRRDSVEERREGEKVDYALDLCLIAEAVFEDEPDLANLIERAAGDPSCLDQ